MKNSITFLFLFSILSLSSQTFLADMPEPVSNNAVTGAHVNGVEHVFSFSGIDSTKKWDGIHKKAFRYNVETDVWDTISDLPSGTGRIAAGASTVKNKIYIMGGYEVFSNGNERTLNEVHIYNPETNEYEPNGKPMPVPVDDHVQVVYKDSLIICVTGWSQSTNVGNVQIYDPSTDEWSVGTTVTTSSKYRAFGAAGVISGDTLYYLGGARIGSNFPASTYLRKGYINPNDPTDISWTSEENPLSVLYRPACSLIDNWPIWFGGSQTTYNFDGIAYNNTGGVEPVGRELIYNPNNGQLSTDLFNSFPDFMDYRGVASFPFNKYYFCGGMESGQKVSNKTFMLQLFVLPTKNIENQKIEIFPNPASDFITIKTEGKFKTSIYDLYGKLISTKEYLDTGNLNVTNLISGTYVLKTSKNGHLINSDFVFIK